jgi:hypothetical protein
MICFPRERHGAAGLTPWQVQRMRTVLRRSACSETWVDDQLVIITRIDAEGDVVACVLFDSRVFPPGGKRETAMRWCRSCGRFTPAPAVQLIERRERRSGPVVSATLQCDDCRIADDEETYRELYDAGLHLQPAGSKSVVSNASRRKLSAPRARS